MKKGFDCDGDSENEPGLTLNTMEETRSTGNRSDHCIQILTEVKVVSEPVSKMQPLQFSGKGDEGTSRSPDLREKEDR